MTVYFLGGGNMAAAIIAGMVRHGGYAIHVVGRNAAKQQQLAERYGVAISSTLPALNADDVLVLAVKPQDMQTATAGINTGGALVLSVAAGLTTATLSRWLGGSTRIIRIMPNTPGQVGMGMAGLYAPAHISAADKAFTEALMRTTGQVLWLPEEDDMHRIVGICASGPAYVFYLLNALQQAAQAQGFDAAEARRLSLATFNGAVALAAAADTDFAQLQQNVTSKGGTTHEAIETFRQHHVAEAIAEGVAACVARSRALGLQFAADAQEVR
jgi:pyrroline-5-carboxylate reductase